MPGHEEWLECALDFDVPTDEDMKMALKLARQVTRFVIKKIGDPKNLQQSILKEDVLEEE